MAPKTSDEPPAANATSDSTAELFAASAAEGAIAHSKSAESLQLDALTTAVAQTSVSPVTTNTSNSSPHTDTPSTVPSEKSEASATRVEVAQTEPLDVNTEKPSLEELELTKEQMIEEALNCPCVAPMKEGSCGDSFIDAYKCFLQSETEPKGMDCMDQFKQMQTCIAEHPDEYDLNDDDPDTDPFAASAAPNQPDDGSPQSAPESLAEELSVTQESSSTHRTPSSSPTPPQRGEPTSS